MRCRKNVGWYWYSSTRVFATRFLSVNCEANTTGESLYLANQTDHCFDCRSFCCNASQSVSAHQNNVR